MKISHKLDRQSFKLRVLKERTIVDRKNRRVIHIINWTIVSPYVFTRLMCSLGFNDAIICGTAKNMGIVVEG